MSSQSIAINLASVDSLMEPSDFNSVAYKAKPKLKFEHFKTPIDDLDPEIADIITNLPKKYSGSNDPEFLKLFEKRKLIFMEDGTDLKNF